MLLSEISAVEDAPEELVGDLCDRAFFGDHPLALPVVGSARAVQRLGLGEIRAHFGRHLVADQLVIAAAGKLEHRALVDLAREHLAALPGVSVGVNFDDIAIVPVHTGMRMLNRSSLFRVVTQVYAHSDLEIAKRAVLDLIAERHEEEDITVLTQDAVVSTFSQILDTLTLVVGAIGAISLSVAGIGIMNVMLVSVSERTREIGLLKAIGASEPQILAAFLTEATFISAAGGLLGLIVGPRL